MAEPSFESTKKLYEETLSTALASFLLLSTPSGRWKPLPSSPAPPSSSKTKDLQNGIGVVDPSSVQVHRRSGMGAEVVRATVEVPVDNSVELDAFEAVLKTAEVRSTWDKLVEHAQVLELLDPQTRITKTDYRLGWPASPRDTITITRLYRTSSALHSISTSLPRTPDEPSFLRPAPPYVRSHVHLLSISVVLLPSGKAARLTLLWEWSLKGAVFSTHHGQLAALLNGFVDFVRGRGESIPFVKGWGRGVEVSQSGFDRAGELGTIEYAVMKDDDDATDEGKGGMDELERRRERKRLERSVEISLSARQGWDVKVVVKGVGDGVETGWAAVVEAVASGSEGEGRLTLRLTHAKIEKPDLLARVSLSIQRLAGGKVIKINGEPTRLVTIEPRNPSTLAHPLLDSDAASVSASSFTSQTSSTPSQSPTLASPTVSASATEIMSLLRRNYIYFTSLLQEPEAKWRHVSDAHGVTVTQLNSIDPTLTIYRAEATFVGVGVWDVFSTICTPGARAYWDKTMEDAVLLDDVNELSSLWHVKTKAAWPVAPRDSVTIRTAYKSPSSVHIFSFSTDDDSLFPTIPPLVPPTIRTQTDLYGWAIEALSPTTTQITLLDQSDPKGWSNKSWTPTQMVNAVAGVGDFSIKFGGPPVVTRLLGAKATLSKYDHERGTLKTEYKAAPISPSTVSLAASGTSTDDLQRGPSASSVALPSKVTSDGGTQMIECEIRCDVSTWAASIDIVIDPPPAKVSCLSRHRLSSGGGMWITIEHDPFLVEHERILVLVRKGSGGREKGSVVVNGSKAKVDVEMLPEDELKLLAKRKRVKASPIPLDQYSTHGPRAWPASRSDSGRSSPMPSPSVADVDDPLKSLSASTSKSTAPLSSSPLSQLPLASPSGLEPPATSPAKSALPPPAQALEALSWLQTFHAEQGPELTDPAPGWAIVSERTGTVVRKKIIPRVSEALPVYRGDKIVQGLTADEIASVVSAVGCRKYWDERIETALPLATYGHGCSTAVITTKPTFPFKGRIFHVASINAQCRVPSASAAASTSTVLFCASSSYVPDETFDESKINPTSLLPGQVLLEGWILETLDPYTSSMLAIPSTRCTYVACVDHSGSVPLAQSVLNANLARLIGAVEHLGKTKGPLPRLWRPDAGMQIEGPLNDDPDQECVWRVSNIDQSSVLLTTDFSIEDGTFRSMFRISGPPMLPPPLTQSTILPSAPVGAVLKSELPRSASLSNFATSLPSNLSLPKPTSNGELARKTSLSSLRASVVAPTVTKRSLSPAAVTDASPTDLVVAELIVDLKQFLNGYSIACSSSLALDPSEPLSIEPLRSLAARQVPLYATVHEAPLPSIVSASLDSWKRHNHLVRILVPTSAITHPVQDPLRVGKTKPTPPDWFKKLVERGAVVDVRIVPLPADANEKLGPTRVMFNGEKLGVLSQRESRSVLSMMEDDDWPPNGAKISRVPRKRKTTNEGDTVPSLLPLEFQAPVAVAVRLLTPKPESQIVDDSEFPDPKSPGAVTPSGEEEGPKSPVLGSKPPLSPTISRRDHASSDASAGGQLLNILGAYPLSRLSSGISTAANAGGGAVAPQRRMYTLSFVLIVALIFFLLGSLLRSLLTPADYIIYGPHKSESQQVERVLMQAFDPDRRWREARRLFEIRSFFFSQWDLIFAAVRRE